MLTIAKFGGSSLAEGSCFRNVRKIVQADPARKGIVVSAPGKRFAGDDKITDLLYRCFDRRKSGGDWHSPWRKIADRFLEIRDTLGVLPKLEQDLLDTEIKLASAAVSREELASRGEHYSARLLAAALGRKFVDSTAWLRFTADGRVDTVRSYGLLHCLAGEPFVTPGFYGARPDGSICTFPRGGSDITGALAAAALEAGLYENWTDVPGVLMADPAIYAEAKPTPFMTYGELAELSAVGTQVLHEDAVEPVRRQGIPLRICSAAEPQAEGTWIAPAIEGEPVRRSVVSVTGRRNRVLLSGVGAVPVQTDCLAEIPGQRMASLSAAELLENEEIFNELGAASLRDGMAMVAVVFAENAAGGPCAADLLWALRQAEIPVCSFVKAYGSHTLLLFVQDTDYERTVRTICRAAE